MSTALFTAHDLDEVPGLRAPFQPTQRTLSERRHPPRFLPRRVADMGVIGCAIREAIFEIHHIGTKEHLEPPAIERIIDKHLSRLIRPRT